MKTEYLKERWFTFQRFYFKSGYIDRWMGDLADDPNRPVPSNINFNASASYLRLSGTSIWVNIRELPNDIKLHYLLKFANDYDARDVWHVFVDQLCVEFKPVV